MKAALIIRTLALGWALLLIVVALAAAVVFPQHDPEILADTVWPVSAALLLALGAHLFVLHFKRRPCA